MNEYETFPLFQPSPRTHDDRKYRCPLAIAILLGIASIASAQAIAQTLPETGENAELQQLAVAHYSQIHRVDAREALRRLEIQDRAAGLDDKIAAFLGDQYAGIWYEADDAGRLKIGISPGAAPQAYTVRRIVDGYGLSADTDLVFVRYTERELQTFQARIRNAILDLVGSGHAATAYNTRSNTVVVNALTRLPSIEEARVQEIGRMAGVTLRRVGIASFAGSYDSCIINSCNPPFRGGRGLIVSGTSPSCTAGFVAVDRNDPNRRWSLTAGHCVFFGGTSWSARDEANSVSLLSSKAFLFFAGGTGLGMDAGIVSVNANSFWATPTPIAALIVKDSANTTFDPTYAVRSTASSSIGQSICRTGAKTGTECGEVVDLGADHLALGPDGGWYTTTNMGEVDVCGSQGGDSGGPLYKHHRAYGILSGHTSAGPAFCHEYYQGVRGAEKALNVSVLVAP